MATACNNISNNTNTVAVNNLNQNAEMQIKGKDINPLLLLMMLQANSEDGKNLMKKLSDAEYNGLDMNLNIFLLLSELEEKNRESNQAGQKAVLASVSEAESQYQAAVKDWKKAQETADEVFQNSIIPGKLGNNWKNIFINFGTVGGCAILGAAIGCIGGPGGAIAGFLLGLAIGGIIIAITRACKPSLKDLSKMGDPTLDPTKQGDITNANTDVTQAQNDAQQKEQIATTLIDSELNPAQQTASTIFTMYNAFINWFGQLSQIFNGG